MQRRAWTSRLLVAFAVAVCIVVGSAVVPRLSTAASQVRATTLVDSTPSTAHVVDLNPPTWAADATVSSVEIFSAPDQDTGKSLSTTPEGASLVFLVLGQQPGWVHVQLPERPNEASGWVHASDVRMREVTEHIVVSLHTHTVTLLDRSRVVLTTNSVNGAPASPTPTGSFYVTSIIHIANPNGPYGAGALGVAGFSNVYETFGGGPGQIALHGTNEPQLMGQSVSHGCVRMPNDVWTRLSGLVPTGTPVLIQA